jgi:phosphoglycerate dehydrogenase-like enzyme
MCSPHKLLEAHASVTAFPIRILGSGVMARQIEARREALAQQGIELVIAPGPPRRLTEAELIELLPGCIGALAGMDAYTERVFATVPSLRIVARIGVGYDRVDVDAATRHGVWVTITPGANHRTVADATFCAILALARRFVEQVNDTRAGNWNRLLGVDVCGKTLGIIGTGRIGREVAKRARGFDMRILVYDIAPDERWAAEAGATYVSLPTLMAEADFITLHAPNTPQTRGIICAETLRYCKPTAFLINTARGELIDDQALLDALNAGRLAGAALDVFLEEPPDALPLAQQLIRHPKVLPTPHTAGLTVESVDRMIDQALRNILAVVRGERPPDAVNTPPHPRG